MPGLLIIATVEYGGYISLIKFVPLVVLFFLWLAMVHWVHEDTDAVETSEMWTWGVFGSGVAALFLWLLLPFWAGLVLYLLAAGGASLSYVIHRNALVPEFDKVMTADHIRGLFTNEEKKHNKLKSFIFITANKNEVPMPQPKTEDFFGYKTTCDLFTDAIWRRADNMIFSPGSEGYRVVYNIDGVASAQPSMDRDQMESFVRFIKKLANLDEKEKRKPQRGRFKIRQHDEKIDWEVVTAGSTVGEQVNVKRIKLEDTLRLDEIGLWPNQYEQISKISTIKKGLFLVTGPTKSGVTTTFYSLIRNHDAFLNSINTLEKQPVAELPNVVQEVYSLSDTGTTTYAKKLHRIVRMGPDIVGVADCSDSETAQIACEAAKSGKIVYVVLKADSVLQALSRWIKLVGDRNIAIESLIGISNQRLLRKLCPECKQAYESNPELLRKLNLPADKGRILYRAGKVQYDKHGKAFTCEECQGTGFVGREGVFETVEINDDLRKFIRQSKTLSDISAQFRIKKMLYLQEQALRKVINGTTAVNEIVQILSDQASSVKKKQKPKS